MTEGRRQFDEIVRKLEAGACRSTRWDYLSSLITTGLGVYFLAMALQGGEEGLANAAIGLLLLILAELSWDRVALRKRLELSVDLSMLANQQARHLIDVAVRASERLGGGR